MLGQTLLALGLTLVSACLINWGYLTEHAAASTLPPLSPRLPRRSLQLLLGSRRWLAGFAAETAGFVGVMERESELPHAGGLDSRLAVAAAVECGYLKAPDRNEEGAP